MKKVAAFFTVLSLLFIPNLGICGSNGWTGNLNGFIGYKNQKDSFFEEAQVDDHVEIGLLLDFKPSNWPVSIAIDGFRSVSGETPFMIVATLGLAQVESRSEEIDIGIRKIWDTSPRLRPYVGGGIAFIDSEIRGTLFGTSYSAEDTGTGVWIDAGFYWTLAKHINIGFDLRYSYAEVTLEDEDANAGGFHAGVIFGFHW